MPSNKSKTPKIKLKTLTDEYYASIEKIVHGNNKKIFLSNDNYQFVISSNGKAKVYYDYDIYGESNVDFLLTIEEKNSFMGISYFKRLEYHYLIDSKNIIKKLSKYKKTLDVFVDEWAYDIIEKFFQNKKSEEIEILKNSDLEYRISKIIEQF